MSSTNANVNVNVDTNVDTNTNVVVNVDTNTNASVTVDTNVNASVDLNINITRNSVSTRLRHNFKPNAGLNKRPMEKLPPTPSKVENFEQVPMFDRWTTDK